MTDPTPDEIVSANRLFLLWGISNILDNPMTTDEGKVESLNVMLKWNSELLIGSVADETALLFLSDISEEE